jgi:hypothetical protein
MQKTAIIFGTGFAVIKIKVKIKTEKNDTFNIKKKQSLQVRN